jgi:hypothetical protein
MRRMILIGAVAATLLLAACSSETTPPEGGTLDPSAPDTTSAPATTSAPDTTSAPAATSAPDNTANPADTEDSDVKWGVVIFIVLLIAGIIWAASRSGAKKGAADQTQAQQAMTIRRSRPLRRPSSSLHHHQRHRRVAQRIHRLLLLPHDLIWSGSSWPGPGSSCSRVILRRCGIVFGCRSGGNFVVSLCG